MHQSIKRLTQLTRLRYWSKQNVGFINIYLGSENLHLTINRRWCKKCLLCVEFCPKGLLHMEYVDGIKTLEMRNPEECIRCGKCQIMCPDFALREHNGELADGEDILGVID